MSPTTIHMENAEHVAQLLRGISSPLRLLLLCNLLEGELFVNEINERLGTTAGNISQHLRVLELNGFVQKRRAGFRTYYRIKDKRIRKVINLLHKLYCPTLLGKQKEKKNE